MFKRQMVISGNWKMNKLPSETEKSIEKINQMCINTKSKIIVCVPYLCIYKALNASKDTKIYIGSQNCHHEESGAFTGEISAKMLKDTGVDYTIVGHSERRKNFNESDKQINLKIKLLLKVGINPILCIGESLSERESGRQKDIVLHQIKSALDGIRAKDVGKIIVAYEPLWAIGTGKTATPEQANDICLFIRSYMGYTYGESISQELIIQYGGSINSSNAESILSQSEIDGALVGGSSLNSSEFSYIIHQSDRYMEKRGY